MTPQPSGRPLFQSVREWVAEEAIDTTAAAVFTLVLGVAAPLTLVYAIVTRSASAFLVSAAVGSLAYFSWRWFNRLSPAPVSRESSEGDS